MVLLVAACMTGSSHTSVVGCSLFVVGDPHRLPLSWHAASLRGRFWDQFYSYCIQQTCFNWFMRMAWIPTSLLMTRRYMALVVLVIARCFRVNVSQWMRSNRLQLNADKTEVIWFSSARRQHQIPTAQFVIGNDVINPVSSVRDLGIYLDSDLSMRSHVSRTVSACFASLRQIRSIRWSITRPVLEYRSGDLTMAVQHWLVYLLGNSTDCSRS